MAAISVPDVEFRVVCDCGDELSATVDTDYRGNTIISTEKCERCWGDASKEGYEQALEDT